MLLKELRKDYELFTREVNSFCIYAGTLKSLYLDAEKGELRTRFKVSPIFFLYHNQMLLERIYLAFRQFSDPSGLIKKNGRPSLSRHNLSFHYFLESLLALESDLPFPKLAPTISEQIDRLMNEIAEFDKKVNPIKATLHKKIGHFDKEIRQQPEDLVWLDRADFDAVCILIPSIANHIGLLGWNFSISFVDPNQNFDLTKFKRQFGK